MQTLQKNPQPSFRESTEPLQLQEIGDEYAGFRIYGLYSLWLWGLGLRNSQGHCCLCCFCLSFREIRHLEIRALLLRDRTRSAGRTGAHLSFLDLPKLAVASRSRGDLACVAEVVRHEVRWKRYAAGSRRPVVSARRRRRG